MRHLAPYRYAFHTKLRCFERYETLNLVTTNIRRFGGSNLYITWNNFSPAEPKNRISYEKHTKEQRNLLFIIDGTRKIHGNSSRCLFPKRILYNW